MAIFYHLILSPLFTGSKSTWNFAFFAPTLILPVALIIILMAPDSPRALMIRGEGEEALQALYFYQVVAIPFFLAPQNELKSPAFSPQQFWE